MLIPNSGNSILLPAVGRPHDTLVKLIGSERHIGSVSLLPDRRLVVLEEIAPDVFSGIEARDDGIDDSCSAVHDVEWWVKTMLGRLAGRNRSRILIRDPSRVHGIHVNAVFVVVRR